MSAWQATATELAGEVYAAFLEEVVAQGVLNGREGPRDEKTYERVAKGTHIDGRVPRLMTISGKGGWSADPEKRRKYAANTNETLLDHLLSVVRGALLLYALDKLGQNPDMDLALLRRRLRVIAAIAFLHDLDKWLDLERNTALPLPALHEIMEQYGLTVFLAPVVTLSAEQVRYLIELVEDTQRHRNPPTELPLREYEALMGYIALADKLDGIWLSPDSDKGGITGVIAYLSKVQTLRIELLREWRILDLYDPHHPFLLDELQRLLSGFSLLLCGIPPLLEVHHDGRLFMLLPVAQYETVVDRALHKLCADLPFALDVVVSNRGMPALYDGQPDYPALQAFIAELPRPKLARLFLVKADLQTAVTPELDRLLGDLGLKPTWPRTPRGLASPYATLDALDADANVALRKAALLTLLLNLNVTGDKKGKAADHAQREQVLLETLDRPRPAWLNAIQDDASRRTLTALWVLALAESDDIVETAVWSGAGILQRWLEGEDDQPGFNAFIEGRGAQITVAVEQHFRQLLNRQRIAVADESAENRCLFTDEPVPEGDIIDEALGLYEVKISAFSGRDNRLETTTSERSQTHVGAISIAEHKLRARIHEAKGGKPDGVPTLISSPSTSGLFGGLGLTVDPMLPSLSPYDLNRLEIKKDAVIYRGIEIYRRRYRVARFERMPDKTADQIKFLDLLLRACRRLGRPIHVFRGLPTPQRAFFHCDALPRLLADLIGGHSLRLEQLPRALQQLQLARILLETHGLGYDVLMLYASPTTRFAATCLAWCRLRDDLKDSAKARESGGLRFALGQLEHELEQRPEDSPMNEQDGALVRLGEAVARIQRQPLAQASTSEEMLVFKLCLDFAENARACHQTDEASLINGIASELETNLGRKDKVAASRHRGGRTLREESIAVAEQFVREVWQGVLRQRPPTQRCRRTMGSIYRMAFLKAARVPKDDQDNTPKSVAA
ncbi:MAG: hypothetical protein JNJ76_09845 [Candidatus Competibacter sp.]|nr:hypothetical protein [Candidatus Competibacter sp.]